MVGIPTLRVGCPDYTKCRGLVICDAWSVVECVMNNLTSAEITCSTAPAVEYYIIALRSWSFVTSKNLLKFYLPEILIKLF